MKIIEVFLKASEEGEVVYGVAVVQRREQLNWHTKEAYVLRSDDFNSKRSLLVEDNERVIIDGRSNVEEIFDPTQNVVRRVSREVTDAMIMSVAAPLIDTGPPPGPLPPGTESQIGVWREADEQDWSRTGAKYRIY